jgi:hypothetical protein
VKKHPTHTHTHTHISAYKINLKCTEYITSLKKGDAKENDGREE